MTRFLYSTIVKVVLVKIYAMVFFLHLNCSSRKLAERDSFIAIGIKTHFDFAKGENGELIQVEDSFRIVFHEGFVLYQVPHLYYVSESILKGDTIEEKISSSEIKHDFFVYKKGKCFGYQFDSLSSLGRVFSVDSFLSKKSFLEANFYDKEKDSLTSIVADTGSNFVTEIYIPKSNLDRSYPDSTYLSFSNEMKQVGFSFSKYLDSARNSKLTKVVFVFNPSKLDGKFAIPRRVMVFEMRKYNLSNFKEFITVFERAELLYKVRK